ncbi:MAG: YidC/Oxa1 family membrane protein insertase [Candidatus Taylorbacteria bacterium]|nr:YidC/Oxa1 family membrane protein insertase [Candidatus Taylorbacteria bacterium]
MYNEIIFRPLYNGLIGIMNLLPWVDVGIAVIIFTVIVKVILYPLSKSALLTQVRMKEIEPEATKIRSQYANDKQLQAQKVMELYKLKKVKPFSGILLLIIQLPILFALISVFYKIIPTIDTTLLYDFISVPVLKTMFLGIFDLTRPDSPVFYVLFLGFKVTSGLILGLATGFVQFFQLKYSLASQTQASAPQKKSGVPDMANIASSMNTQMKYFVPILAFASIYWIIPATFPGASSIIALYWMTSSLVTLLQELYIRKKHIRV